MSTTSRLRACLWAASLIIAPSAARAQAWVAPPRVGAVSVATQVIENTGHRVDDGTSRPVGTSVNVSIAAQFDYAFTRRFSMTVALPFVMSKWTDAGEPPPFLPFLEVDHCRCWNGAFQDVVIVARQNVVNYRRVFGVTPSTTLVLPSHPYDFRGEAVPGRRLRELRVAVDAGVQLDPITPRLRVSGSYAFGLVERPLGIPNNRSLASIEAGFALSRKLSVRGLINSQHTHGGLRFPADVEEASQDLKDEHDRLLRDNYVHVGAGGTYAWRRLQLFGTAVFYASGVNTHMGRAITIGVSTPFERAAPKSR